MKCGVNAGGDAGKTGGFCKRVEAENRSWVCIELSVVVS
jgi:hypothetical protein